jgi:hypothetical protein
MRSCLAPVLRKHCQRDIAWSPWHEPQLRRPAPLQHGPSAFLPYLSHLVGQPAATPGGSTSSNCSTGNGPPAPGSGLLGCLARQDWTVRRAAADALSAAALLLGPELEPEGAWAPGDPASLTWRCLAVLEDARFDKVRRLAAGLGFPQGRRGTVLASSLNSTPLCAARTRQQAAPDRAPAARPGVCVATG